MATRRQARRQAIDILYQADVTQADPLEVVTGWAEAGTRVAPFARELVAGVTGHLEEIDAAIERSSQDWAIDRLAALDRTILRVACFELFHRPDVPPAAAINEAVEAAKELSTEDSSRFVNGVLGSIAREIANGVRPSGDAADRP